MVPSGASLCSAPLVFPAGSLIHTATLFSEIEHLKLKNEIIIHPQAGIVSDTHANDQAADPFYQSAGSTLTGTGAATATRAKRRLTLAKDEDKLKPYLYDTAQFVHKMLSDGKRILVEGAQGYGLSNYHGDYPYVSSRDCTVGAVLSQLGLGPSFLENVILVAKCFPTRNSHGIGRLPNEIKLEGNDKLSSALAEFGGGSYNGGDERRRVSMFDFEIVRQAIIANSATGIALTGLDRLEELSFEPSISQYYGSPAEFMERLEREFKTPIVLEGWGPYVENVKSRDRVAKPEVIG